MIVGVKPTSITSRKGGLVRRLPVDRPLRQPRSPRGGCPEGAAHLLVHRLVPNLYARAAGWTPDQTSPATGGARVTDRLIHPELACWQALTPARPGRSSVMIASGTLQGSRRSRLEWPGGWAQSSDAEKAARGEQVLRALGVKAVASSPKVERIASWRAVNPTRSGRARPHRPVPTPACRRSAH